jgi:two-component system sensor histidine kinase KdpD
MATLKLFLSYAPGTGKTCTMLTEAHRRRERGEDLVVGVVESHGRQAVKNLLSGLEQVPFASVPYRNVTLQEVDVETIVRRKPAVVLMDEFAHRNVPGSRHTFRYEDVAELLEHGIDVLSTLNVQHLESIAPLAAEITGVVLQETVPDETLRIAEEVVFVDATPVALRNRILRGDVLQDEQIHRAMNGYYREENLFALRELAMQKVAEQVDVSLRKQMTQKDINESLPVRERVVVFIDADQPAERLQYLISRGCAKARRLEAELHVVYLEVDDGGNKERGMAIKSSRLFAEHLGAKISLRQGIDLRRAVLDFARENHVTQIVLGYPGGGYLRRFAYFQKVQGIMDELPAIEVHIIKYRMS